MKNLLVILILLYNTTYADSNIIKRTAKVTAKYEGYSKHLYVDVGGFSIGYGTNLAYGISKAEAMLLLEHRLEIVHKELSKLPWFSNLSDNRKMAIVDMGYNLGVPRLMKFKVFLWRLKNGYYHGAANALKNSLWYTQVGTRAKHIYQLIHGT